MFNHVFAKVSRRVAIISLIATFSVVGIISCGGSDDITGGSGYSRVDGGDNGGPVRTNDSNLPDMPYSLAVKPSWATNQDDGTHYKIYIPFWGWTNVSYKDTTTLNKLYRQFIESGRGGRSNPGQSRWFIRNGNNFLSNPIEGEYYYFDKDLNIRYHGSIPGYEKRVMYRYLGAVIINYSWNNGEGGWGNGSGPGLLAGRLRMEKLGSLVSSGKLNVHHMVSHVFEGWDNLEKALFMMRDKPADLIKPVVSIEK